MAVDVTRLVKPALLEEAEHDALRSAAVWYYKRHAPIIAERADDRSGHASAQRERFLDLHAALAKLGVRLALPDGIRPRE